MVLGISVNIPAKTFCPAMCILFVCSKSCFSTFGRLDWAGWRLARGEDGRGWSTRVPQEIPHFSVQNECDSLIDHRFSFYFNSMRFIKTGDTHQHRNGISCDTVSSP